MKYDIRIETTYGGAIAKKNLLKISTCMRDYYLSSKIIIENAASHIAYLIWTQIQEGLHLDINTLERACLKKIL